MCNDPVTRPAGSPTTACRPSLAQKGRARVTLGSFPKQLLDVAVLPVYRRCVLPGPQAHLGPGHTWALAILGPIPLGPWAHLGLGPTWSLGPTWALGTLGPPGSIWAHGPLGRGRREKEQKGQKHVENVLICLGRPMDPIHPVWGHLVMFGRAGVLSSERGVPPK